MKEEIISVLKKALEELDLKGVEPTLEIPGEASHGDYASNIAMAIFFSSKFKVQSSKFRTPLELAQEIIKILNTKYLIHNTDRVEAVKPGFINFWLSRQYLREHLREIVGKNSLLALQGLALQGKKVMVEFADPNPFKEFHIGHLRNISLGESLSRLLEAQGAKVFRANYQGDVGMHVAKALYGIMNYESGIMDKKDLSIEEKVKLLGEAYALGSKAYDEDEEAKKEIQELNIKIYQLRFNRSQNDSKIREIWEMGRKWSLDAFEKIYKRLGTRYDYYYFESQTAPIGRQLVLDHIKDEVFERHDGAVVFRGEKFGLHTRVFVTKEDYATYEAKDLALAQLKHKDVPYDQSIIITAHEQAPYFSVILAAMKLVSPDLAAKTIHHSFGFVSLKEGKMSSRSGNVVTTQWLLDEAKTRIKAQFKEISEETAEKVAVGAVKYSMLKFSTSSDISFSFDESISLEGNSGPYLQYSFARTQSVLAKANSKNVILRAKPEGSEILPLHSVQGQNDNRRGQNDISSEELSILRLIHRFPEVVQEAAEGFAPNMLCNYLFDLAQAFNLFYQKHKIIDPSASSGREAETIRAFRLTLTVAVGQILKNGLFLLGIEAPQRM